MSEQMAPPELPAALARAKALPSLPSAVLELIRLAGDADVSIGALTAQIARDPALTARLLQAANSSMFRRGAEIATLEQATMLLGIKAVKLMALSLCLTSSLPRAGSQRGFDYAAYWQRSLATAVSSRSLARVLGNPLGEEAFLAGLLSRFGQLVMAQALPTYARVISRSPGPVVPAALEAEVLGFDLHRVGGALLHAWQLPSLIHATVSSWGEPLSRGGELEPAVAELARLVHVGDLTAAVLLEPDRGSALQRLHAGALELLALSEREIESFVLGLEPAIAETAALLDVEMPDAESHEAIMEEARQQMTQLSVAAAVELQHSELRAQELEAENQHLQQVARTDRLTGVPNRAHFDFALEHVVEARAASSGRPPGVLILDVDHFKRVNDAHGHPVGDRVLQRVGEVLRESIRESDITARYGGEEFAVIVPGTSFADLHAMAERIRKNIAAVELEHAGQRLRVTASVGGAMVRRPRSGDAARLLALADANLYEAKDAGRNRSVCCEVEELEDGNPRGPSFFGPFLLRAGEIDEAQLDEALALMARRNRRLGELAVAAGLLTPLQVERIRERQMLRDRAFGDMAVELGLLDRGDLEELLCEQESGRLHLGEALVELGHLQAEALPGLLADFEQARKGTPAATTALPPELASQPLAMRALDRLPRLLTRLAGVPVRLGAGRHAAGEPLDSHRWSVSADGLVLTVSLDARSFEALGDAAGEMEEALRLLVRGATAPRDVECGPAAAVAEIPRDGFVFDLSSPHGAGRVVISPSR